MKDLMLFTGLENNLEYYQLTIGQRCVMGIRDTLGPSSREEILKAIGEKFASAIFEYTPNESGAYTILSQNGVKLNIDYEKNKVELLKINKLEDSVIKLLSNEINNKLNELLKEAGEARFSFLLDDIKN